MELSRRDRTGDRTVNGPCGHDKDRVKDTGRASEGFGVSASYNYTCW